MEDRHHHQDPDTAAGDETCPLCGRPPARNGIAFLVGQFVGLLISAVIVAALVYWPIRWIAGLYLELFGG